MQQRSWSRMVTSTAVTVVGLFGAASSVAWGQHGHGHGQDAGEHERAEVRMASGGRGHDAREPATENE